LNEPPERQENTMNHRFGREHDDRFRNDPRYTRSREPDGGFWERGDEDRTLRSPDQEFETSGSYRQPAEDFMNQGRGSARSGSAFPRNQLTDYSNGGQYGRSSSHSAHGGFAGRGPKGYVRTDERIRDEVCDRLSWNDEVDATDLTVLVSQGEVTLEGSVQTRHMKRLAEDIAESVAGVLDVHNTIRVQKPMLTELKEKLTGEEQEQHYANTGTKTTATTSEGGHTNASGSR
jgi:BON domain